MKMINTALLNYFYTPTKKFSDFCYRIEWRKFIAVSAVIEI